MPEALKAAGFEDKVKLIGNGAGPQQFQALIDGGWTPPGWRTRRSTRAGRWSTRRCDWSTAARVPDGYQEENEALPSYIVDTPEAAKALAPSFDYAGPAGYEDQFKKLWLVG